MVGCRNRRSERNSLRGLICGLVTLLVVSLCSSQAVQADGPIKLAESQLENRVYSNQSQISTVGKVLASKSVSDKEELALTANVNFDFLSRRLPSAGRDAMALREIREFVSGKLTTSVSGFETSVDLPENRRLIVANGNREGLINYCPDGPLSRETLDLLDIPGDPLALLALLPLTEVRVAEEWTPADWVLQMLTGVEAVETTEMKCRLDQATPTTAKVTFNGKIKGQRLGTNTTVSVVGVFLFNLEKQYLSQAKTVYTVGSDVGTVNPGLDMQITTVLARAPVENVGKLTNELVASIPLEAPPETLNLQYEASPWGMTLRHGRDWHLFQAVYDAAAPVAILRLVELGSLVAQCNLSPAPPASEGQTTPLERFEADIQQSLGERFTEVVSREKIPADGGRSIYRVEVSGNVVIKSTKGRADIPMLWIYYLVADPKGRQASFVFSVEPSLMEQLRGRDKELVHSLQFVVPKR